MAERDFYEVLGVSRGASQDEIKRAYRDKARKLHPDVNKAPDAQKQFAELQNAYDTLSDEKKRQLYDRFGHANGAAGDPDAWASQVNEAGFDFGAEELGDLFEVFFGGGRQRSPFSRAGRRPASAPRPRRGADATHAIDVSFETMARGGRETLRVVGETTRTIELTIPAGIDDGATLRVGGAGGAGVGGGPAGDLLVKVRVGGHPLYERPGGKGLDLHLTLPITIAEATLGGRIAVPTLEGRVTLTVPPSTPSGVKLRLKGRGIRTSDGRSGDLLCTLRIVPPDPEHLSEDDRTTLTRIGEQTPVRMEEIWGSGDS